MLHRIVTIFRIIIIIFYGLVHNFICMLPLLFRSKISVDLLSLTVGRNKNRIYILVHPDLLMHLMELCLVFFCSIQSRLVLWNKHSE